MVLFGFFNLNFYIRGVKSIASLMSGIVLLILGGSLREFIALSTLLIIFGVKLAPILLF